MSTTNLTDKVKPVNSNHSIKEAVIGLFLANPIVKPERFKELIENEFKDIFQQFEPIIQLQFELKAQNRTMSRLNIERKEMMDNVGFKFTSFEKGAQTKILQGQNDNANQRTFISYHTLNYTRWEIFFNDFLKIITSISNFSNDIFLTAFSLHYVDEFLWLDNNSIDLNLVFNKEANSIPRDFFNASVKNYSIVTEREKGENKKYIDRLEIIVNNLIKPSITISNNITQTFTEVVSLKELLPTSEFKNTLDEAHQHNKDFLKNLLTEEVQDMIHIK
jgi:uncharacterized protein (TIGR04255 family)